MSRIFILLSIMGVLAPSCAYKLQKGSLSLNKLDAVNSITKIHVPIVDNLSAEAGPEMVLTSALRESLASVSNVELVPSSTEADYLLLVRIKNWGRLVVGNTRQARSKDQAIGGLIEGQVSAADIQVFMDIEVELLENLKKSSTIETQVQKSIWIRNLSEERNFEAFRRFDEVSGSSSAFNINRSREELQLRNVSQSLARQVLDQVAQDF